ncbi:RNA polymerase sigma factor [Plebeiibacterium marinum]|uniref:RNA polymerase sigma factor n=1 Tax=Plebeiibacterium marinum TaxID=2992111 RepID=A0AAE3MHM8_9BACT|nr:RNA polymerase sigma factor [Plebeiobacterium marinum]MCW3807904.1 RNA polymerase sigma factor [Plebeiobacterium marinum]
MKRADQIKISDEVLIQQYYQGDSNGIEVLYNRYYLKVFNKCLSFTHNMDDAFDLTQDIFVKVFSKKNAFKGNSLFSTWLYAVVFNHCASSVKVKSRSKQEFFDLLSVPVAEDDDMDRIEERRLKEDQELYLYRALDEIPEQDKVLLELKYQNNYSVKDIQSELQISESAVKMRLMRARQKVGKYYHKAI